MRLSPDPTPGVFGGGTPIYGRFRVDASAVTDNGDTAEQTGDWEYYVTGYSESFFIPQNTIPKVGGTKDKGAINDFTNAFKEAVSRLDDADCAKLFGGKVAALKALYGASYSYRDLGNRTYDADTQTVKVVGAATYSNTNPPSVYINNYGPFRNTNLLVMTPSGVRSMTVDFGTRLGGAEFGALLLLHELGHLTGIFKPDAGNNQLNRSYTQQVQDACFKKK